MGVFAIITVPLACRDAVISKRTKTRTSFSKLFSSLRMFVPALELCCAYLLLLIRWVSSSHNSSRLSLTEASPQNHMHNFSLGSLAPNHPKEITITFKSPLFNQGGCPRRSTKIKPTFLSHCPRRSTKIKPTFFHTTHVLPTIIGHFAYVYMF